MGRRRKHRPSTRYGRLSTRISTGCNSKMQDIAAGDSPDSRQTLESAIASRSELQTMKSDLEKIDALALRIASTLANGFGQASRSGKTFNETLNAIGKSLLSLALKESTRAITTGLVKDMASFLTPQASSGASIIPHANGGIIASPTYFASGQAIGLMGERGAEAIMPLARGADGRLGVVAQGEGGRPVSVTVNIAASDMESFRRSESQIAGALTRAVARGQRHL
jgi:hypothetical protein